MKTEGGTGTSFSAFESKAEKNAWKNQPENQVKKEDHQHEKAPRSRPYEGEQYPGHGLRKTTRRYLAVGAKRQKKKSRRNYRSDLIEYRRLPACFLAGLAFTADFSRLL